MVGNCRIDWLASSKIQLENSIVELKCVKMQISKLRYLVLEDR